MFKPLAFLTLASALTLGAAGIAHADEDQGTPPINPHVTHITVDPRTNTCRTGDPECNADPELRSAPAATAPVTTAPAQPATTVATVLAPAVHVTHQAQRPPVRHQAQRATATPFVELPPYVEL